MKKAFNFLSGTIMGILVGGTLSLLLTPESGVDFRNKIEERIRNIQEEVKAAANNRRIELEEQLTALREVDKSS